MRADRRRTGLATLASFFVYLVPLFGPHAGWTVGQVLLNGLLGKGPEDRPWILANLAVTLSAQILVFLWVRFCLRRRPMAMATATVLLALLALPVAWTGLHFALMKWIPEWRLIEPDDAPEHVTFAEECRLQDKWLSLAGVSGRALLASPENTTIVQASDGSGYWVLRFPGCKLEQIALPKNTVDRAYAPVALARNGRVLYTMAKRGQPLQDTGALIDRKLVPLSPFEQLDPARVTPPRLSPDGGTLTWIERQPGRGGVLKVAALDPSGLRELSQFNLGLLGPGGYDLVDVSDGAEKILLSRNLRDYLLVNAHGKILSTVTLEPGLRPGLGTIRILEAGSSGISGYLTWEGYRDEGHYLAEWRVGDKFVKKEIPKGRAITSADLSPDGKFIAISTAPGVSLGKIQDSVVIWSSDGTEVFRRRLGSYNRSPVAFFAGNLAAYSQIDRQGRGVTHVLKLW